MGGRNLQPLKEIGLALTKVHTDMGLTGVAAEQLTEKFLKYATATKQNAADAVRSFDNILDSWGLTAADATTIMDKLIVSHQKYGGELAANQESLAMLAPALRAANFQIDDGIALLGLFGSKGLDADQATAAFAKSLTKVKSPAELQRLITDISNTTDPFLRASKAADLFGARAGAKLANALGGVDLKSFRIDITEAAGATEKASLIIEDSFSNKIKLAIKGAGAAIIGFGQTIGPLGSALTGLVSIAGALGPKLGPALASALSGAWKIAAGSSLLGPVIAAAGSKAATVYLSALIAGDVIGGALATAWAASGGRLIAAARAAGEASGLSFAGAVKAAIGAGAASAGAFSVLNTPETEALYNEFRAKFGGAGEAGAAALDQGFKQGLTQLGPPIPAGFYPRFTGALTKAVTFASKSAFGSDLAARSDYARAYANFLMAGVAQGILAKRSVVTDSWNVLIGDMATAVTPAQERLRLLGELASKALRDGLRSGDPAVAAQALATRQAIEDRLTELNRTLPPIGRAAIVAMAKAAAIAAHAAGNRAMAGFAQGIRDKRSAVDSAWQTLLDDMKNTLTRTGERAKLLGELVSKELTHGMKSNDPVVRAQAIATKQIILDRLAELGTNAKNIGKTGMAELAKAMKSKDPDIRAAALAIYTAASKVAPPKSKATEWGKAIGQGLINGLNAMAYKVGLAAGNLAKVIADYLATHSPAKRGPWSEGGGPEGWGRAFSALFLKGLTPGVTAIDRLIAGTLSRPGWGALPPLGHAVPSMAMTTARSGVQGISAGQGSYITNNYNVAIEGLVQAKDPISIAREMRRVAEFKPSIDRTRPLATVTR